MLCVQHGERLLQYVCKVGHMDLAKRLIAKGVSLDVADEVRNSTLYVGAA